MRPTPTPPRRSNSICGSSGKPEGSCLTAMEANTFSIVARCARTGELGVAVASAVPAVGADMPLCAARPRRGDDPVLGQSLSRLGHSRRARKGGERRSRARSGHGRRCGSASQAGRRRRRSRRLCVLDRGCLHARPCRGHRHGLCGSGQHADRTRGHRGHGSQLPRARRTSPLANG